MKYFNYQYKGSMGKVWELFKDLGEVPEEEIVAQSSKDKCEYGHTLEIIRSAMNGNMGVAEYENGFDLKAYEYKCQKNDEITYGKLRDKFLSIVDKVGEDDDRVNYGEVSSNTLRSFEESFDLLEKNVAFERCLADLYNIRTKYIVEKGIDPVETVLNSLRGVPEAVNEIKNLIFSDSVLRDIVISLCEGSSGFLEERLVVV